MAQQIPKKLACLGPGFFSSVAWFLSIAASTMCNYVSLDSGNALRDEFDTIGFWCYKVANNDNRYGYGDVDFDDDFRKARVFGTVANVLGFIVWLAVLFFACMPCNSKLLMMWGFLALITCLFEGMKWWILRSPDFCDGSARGCSIDSGGAVSIAAACCWFVSALLICGSSAVATKAGGEEEVGEQEEEVMEDKKAEMMEAPEAPLGESGQDEVAAQEAEESA